MITVEQAIAAILEQIRPLGTERVHILAACGRVLAEDIISGLNVPPHDNSGMDGYAVRYADIEDARPDHPAWLSVAGDLAAGSVAAAALQPGQALRIMTGAPIPSGADTVVKKEDTILEGDIVGILSAGRRGLNVRCAGEDINTGAQVFTRGALLRPAHLGVLASIKRAVVSVYQRPQVAILSTGEELVDIDGDLAPGKIVTSNSYALAGLVADAGAE
ncbi:MAG: molybdopterin molybdotransferase MoeA, partial [Deltaproteobacteria bacterium]|nr:molybdopterin molybdotransferase MoeA [Deltaproteobacteria bacterium]